MEDLLDLTKCDPRYGHKASFSFGHINPTDVLIKQNRSISSMGSAYSMSESPRGYCLLIKNYFTIGTYKEMQRFRNIFPTFLEVFKDFRQKTSKNFILICLKAML